MARPNMMSWLTAATAALALSALAQGEVYRVKWNATGTPINGLTWDTAFRTLQDVFALPPDANDQIWVAAGTYYPDEVIYTSGDRKATFTMVPRVELYGHFQGVNETSPDDRDLDNSAHETILSGDLDGDDESDFQYYADNCQHVLTYNHSNPTYDQETLLDGFTITGGNATPTPGAPDPCYAPPQPLPRLGRRRAPLGP
jgi:hypothetical protein